MSKIRNRDISDIRGAVLWALLSFAFPAAVIGAVMAFCGIAPFGESTLVNEANAAWFESFTGMYRSFVSGEGVFYHLNVGFGSSFYHEFASGLCSPFMFLSFFFGQRSLAAAYSVITIIRTGAAGASAWYMLRKCVGIGRPMSFAVSCGYSLCGFAAFAAYYPSVADGAVFFPLLVSGIYSFVQESRPIRLFVFGGMFFLTCPRLTLLGLIISCIIYCGFYFRRGSSRQRVYKTAMFASTLLCSAAINAVLVIPVWAGSIYYKNGVFSEIRANDILSDLCFGGFGTNPSGGMGLCLAGLLLIGFFAFFFNKIISVREKITIASGALVLILCHSVPLLTKYTLGFGNSDGENVSAGFMLALLCVYCIARNIAERDGFNTLGLVLSASLYVLLAMASLFLNGSEAFSVLAEAGLAVFACAVFIQLFVSREESVRVPAVTAAALALFGVVHCAGAVGRIHSDVNAGQLRLISDSRAEAREMLEESYREKNEEIPRFYRTRSTDGISESVDINRNEVEGLTQFAERLGIMRGSEHGGADNFTEFTDMLFGIANTDFGYYTNEAALHKICSPAYIIGDWDNELPDGLNALELQNYLAEKWFGAKLFEEAEPVSRTTEKSSESERYKWTFGNENTVVDKYEFAVPEGQHIYMLVPEMDCSYAVDGDSRSDWKKACAGGVYSIRGKNGGSVTAYISYDSSSDDAPEPIFMAYTGNIDEDAKSKSADYISYRGSTIRFLFDISKPQTALTSIPYEMGWDVTVNGESVKPEALCGGLLGIRLENGVNSVVMSYTPPHFRFSMWISVILFVVGSYITLKVEHEAARRRKVRMAFRAVELNISRMTVEQLGALHNEGVEKDPKVKESDENDEKMKDNVREVEKNEEV